MPRPVLEQRRRLWVILETINLTMCTTRARETL